MAEAPPRPGLPVWLMVVLGLLALLFVWWLVGLVVGTIGWLLKVLVFGAAVGVVAYLVLTFLRGGKTSS